MDLNPEKFLKTIGSGRMPSTAYDTAWVAMLGDLAPELSNAALHWLCANQLPDGSWGAAVPKYYHDRVISTLAAMIALTRRGRRGTDRIQVDRGREALERVLSGATMGLAADPNGATVGFEMIAPTLTDEAEKLGLIEHQGDRILGRFRSQREAKLNRLSGRINRYVTIAFSSEMAGLDGQDMLDIEHLPEENGSIGYSPSATAYYAYCIRPGDPIALNYLRQVVDPDGGFPDVMPYDTFEVAWSLWNLSLIPDFRVDQGIIKKHLDFLERTWVPGKGSGFASGYSVQDGDDTGLVFDVLLRYGRGQNLDLDVIFRYELENYFQCYALESNPSLSANIHILGALKTARLGADHPSVRKILDFIKGNRTQEGYWLDKWHLSPYYTTAHAVIACIELDDDIAANAVEWIMKSQYAEGGWGCYFPTAEETAYCIQALAAWGERHGNGACREASLRAANWLLEHNEAPYRPLWIGKCLYSPENVIRSAIISALKIME